MNIPGIELVSKNLTSAWPGLFLFIFMVFNVMKYIITFILLNLLFLLSNNALPVWMSIKGIRCQRDNPHVPMAKDIQRKNPVISRNLDFPEGKMRILARKEKT